MTRQLKTDVIYGKSPQGRDLYKIMLALEKMEKVPPTQKARRNEMLDGLALMAMDFIGRWGIHPVELMKQCGLAKEPGLRPARKKSPRKLDAGPTGRTQPERRSFRVPSRPPFQWKPQRD